ncbi:uncharacterized protein LOC120105733 [Phoenix dactylifera]|uniref:Uncharacterized protein LOC120105733 n=1 Tax=Phoenix dactylifera TaxID=42345 RepID=A0A8B8ZSF7_PHODC|nr:uncharacterized protein LOC120105733 [Phoenix dactylifera]
MASECQNKAQRSQRGQEEAERKLDEAEAARREATARMEAAEAKLRSAVERLDEEKASHALARSEPRASKVRLVDTRSEIAGHKYEAGVLRLKIEQLEALERRALEQAQNAMQIFRESDEFRELMEEEAVDGLIRGFEDFRRQMLMICPKFDLHRLQSRLGVIEDDNEPGSPEDDSALDGAPESPEAERGVVEAETEAAQQTARKAPPREADEGAPERASKAAPEATSEAPTEATTDACGDGSAEDPRGAPAENLSVRI